MRCPEYDRLRQQYEAALRYWGYLLLSDANLVEAPARRVAEVKIQAFEERNAAKERWTSHTLTCQNCNPRLQVKPQSVGCCQSPDNPPIAPLLGGAAVSGRRS
jgi:hypothetical protein